MPFAPDEKMQPVKFYFAKDQVEWVDLVLLESEDFEAIRKRLGFREWDYLPNSAKKDALEPVPHALTSDELAAFNREVNFASIPAWHIVDDAGVEIAHSIESVDLMMRKCRAFKNFVVKSRAQLRIDHDKRVDDEIKNS